MKIDSVSKKNANQSELLNDSDVTEPNLVNITFFGKPSSLYNYMKDAALSIAQRANITLNIVEKCEINQLIKNYVMSIPAYELNNEITERGHKELSAFIMEMQLSILRESNFGDMNRIIVPIDFTETSEIATNYALYIAKKKNSAIHLIHAYHPSPLEIDSGLLDHNIIAAREEKLKKYTMDLNNTWVNYKSDPLIDSHFQIGLAADAINEVSRNIENGWIVMGSSDNSKARKKIFGSVSISVATHAKNPVFIIPVDYSLKPIEKVGFCVSDEDIEDSIITQVTDLANLFGAEIHLIHIKKRKDNIDSTKLIDQFSNHYHKELISYKEIETMNMVEGVNIYSEALSLDLLVMNKGKRGLFQEMFHRSFTKRMAISTRIPLLIIK